MSRGRPDFFIAGTMKGGTTALYGNICRHPHIQRASTKEIHYFSLFPHNGDDWYLSHFDPVSDKLTGEASPTYFDSAYTQAIPHCIQAFNPDAKVMVITRDPVDRAASHFYHLQNYNKIAELADLDVNEFFSLDFQNCITVTDTLGFYLQQVLYFSAYARKAMFYRGVFDEEHLLFLDNHDLRSMPDETMNRVFDFLGVDSFQHESFGTVGFTSGRTSSELDADVHAKLTEFFAPDYELYSRITGLPGFRASTQSPAH